jgi:hypothetical protein
MPYVCWGEESKMGTRAKERKEGISSKGAGDVQAGSAVKKIL